MRNFQILSYFVIFLIIIGGGYAFPEIEHDSFIEEESMSIEGWYGTNVQIFINDESFGQTLDLREDLIEVQVEGDSFNINSISATPKQEIEIFNPSGSGTFNLLDADTGDILKEVEVTGGIKTFEIPITGDYILRDTEGEISDLQISVSNEQTSETFSLESANLLEGDNDIRFEITYATSFEDEETQTQESTFEYQRYENRIEIVDKTEFIRSSSTTVEVTTQNPQQPHYFYVGSLVNPQSCLFFNNEIDVGENPTEVTITGLSNGVNEVRIISTEEENCEQFTGEAVFDITVDREPPEIRLVDATIGRFGSDSGRYVDVGDFDDTAYISERELSLEFDTDAEILNYTLNGRGDGPLVDEEALTALDWVERVDAESTGDKLSIDIIVNDEGSSAELEYEYRNREREVSIEDGILSFTVDLRDEEDDEIDIIVRKDADSDEEEITLRIFSLGFEPPGEIQSAQRDEDDERIFTIDLTLEQGENSLMLYAYDRAGNLEKRNHVIDFDDRAPELNWDEMEPKELFEGATGTSRFPIRTIDGKTNKGNVDITVFSVPDGGIKIPNWDDRGTPRSITCENSGSNKEFILRSLDIGSERVRGSELDLNEQQINLGLQSFFSKQDISTNRDGEFEVTIGLQRGDAGRRDFDEDSRHVGDVESVNELCFVMEDKHGNVNIQSKRISFDSGNTMWRPSQTSLTPSTVYAAEIEQTGDQAQQERIQFGVTATFQYQGGGNVERVDGLRLREDGDSLRNQERGKLNILNNQLNYRYIEDRNELVVYFPVEIRPLNKNPLDYPSSLDLKFRADITYDVDNMDVQIDTTNPIYFQDEVNVEKPLDHAKWLSPSTLESGIDFLNDSIAFTRDAVDIMQTASVVGVFACTATRLWAGYRLYATDDPETENDIKERLFYVCDRVACSGAPEDCDTLDEGGSDRFELDGGSSFSREELSQKSGTSFVTPGEEGESRTLGRITSLNTRNQACKTPTGRPGIRASYDLETYEEGGAVEGAWSRSEQTRDSYVRDSCIEANFGDEDTNNKILGKIEEADGQDVSFDQEDYQPNNLNLQDASGVCYTKGAPHFDNTRCFGGKGWDPSNNVIESIRCGCITDTYSHLRNLLQVQEGIKRCLEEAKLGVSSGSYCERLMGQAVCDVATNLVFSGTLGRVVDRTGSDGEDTRNVFSFIEQGNREGNQVINERYDGTMLSDQAMSTDQIINRACLAAVTGDWSILEDQILTAIDTNQVEPIFGPAFPQSRMMGANPFTGSLTIQYRFTHAVVSGGQHIRTEAKLVCDSNQPGGEYCPEGDIVESDKSRIMRVPEGGSVQDTIVMTDENSRFRYNVLRLEHEYQVDGENRNKVQEENIDHRTQGLITGCYWTAGTLGSGAGINCDQMFSEDSMMQQYRVSDSSEVYPRSGTRSPPTIYPGNPLYFKLDFDIRGRQAAQQAGETKLFYKITCQSHEDNTGTTAFENEGISFANDDKVFGSELVKLQDSIPELGIPRREGDYVATVNIDGDQTINSLNVNYEGPEDDSDVSFQIVRIEDEDTGKSFGRTRTFGAGGGSFDLGDDISGRTLNIFFGSQPSGSYDIILTNSDSEQDIRVPVSGIRRVSPTTSGDLEDLDEGICKLQTRILPSGASEGITVDNFEDFNLEDDALTNVREDLIHETEFNLIDVTRDSHRMRLSVFNVVQREPYCINNDGRLNGKIELKIPYVLSNPDDTLEFLTRENLEISYGASRYNFDGKELDKNISIDRDRNLFKVTLSRNESGSRMFNPDSFTREEVDITASYQQNIEEEFEFDTRDTISTTIPSCGIDDRETVYDGDSQSGGESSQEESVEETGDGNEPPRD